ncbi:MAG TPA: tetratricopeptide repeat protein, partial [Bacteroidia bacterium]
GEPLDLLTTAYHNLPALIQQAGKILFPFNLSTLPVIEDTGFYFGIATLLILAIMAYRSKENISRIVFGLCWFLIFLLPTYSVYVSGERMHTDNRLYVPIAGLLFTVAALKPIYKINFKNLPSKIIFACIVLCFSVSTIIYSPVFENRFSFYENAAAHSPHSVLAQKGAGDNYFLKKDFNNAAAQYRKALQLSPSLVGLHTNLGLIDLNKNLPAEAEQEFKTEIQLNPQFEKGYYNLAMLYFKQKKTGEAQFYLEKTVSINPTNWKAFYLLGVIFSKQGKRKEAESCFAKAQRYKS